MAVSMNLVGLIENNADELTKKWMRIVRSHPDTPTYHQYPENKLYDRAFSVYSQLGKALSSETTKEEIKKQYMSLGAQRRIEGFKLSELVQALIITRRVLWLKIQSDGLLNSAMDLTLALELSNHVILFFDRAIFFATKGYLSDP